MALNKDQIRGLVNHINGREGWTPIDLQAAGAIGFTEDGGHVFYQVFHPIDVQKLSDHTGQKVEEVLYVRNPLTFEVVAEALEGEDVEWPKYVVGDEYEAVKGFAEEPVLEHEILEEMEGKGPYILGIGEDGKPGIISEGKGFSFPAKQRVTQLLNYFTSEELIAIINYEPVYETQG